MSKYSGLDKLIPGEATFIESYNGGKVYKDEDGFISVMRNYIIDMQHNCIEHAWSAIDHFRQDL